MNSTVDYESTDHDVSIAMGVICGLFEVWALLRTWNWSKRAGKQPVDPMSVATFFVNSCGFIANAFVLVVIGASFNWFIINKRQSISERKFPSSSQQRSLHIYLFIALFLKAINLIQELVILCKVDVFFIDWERPKVRGHKVSAKEKPVIATTDDIESGNKPANGTDKDTIVHLQEKLVSNFPVISIWRTYFVANEWVKLCAFRKLNLSLHLFFVLLLLNTFGLEGLSVSESSDKKHSTEKCTVYRIATGGFVYMILALVQILLKKFVYMKIVKDKIREFVDLCSVSNVSLFCFRSKRFGYYIHGRSPNGHSDVNMKEMHEYLKREEEDLCPKRGLIPNTDQQTFEMSLPTAVNDNYKRIRTVLTAYSQATDRMQGIGGNLFKVDIEKVIPTYHTINKFLSGFIEHAYKDVDYTVQDKSTIEMILDTEFTEPLEKGIFYNDNGSSFEAVLLCGIESNLFIFELLLFLVVDIISQSFTTAVIFTFIISKVIHQMYVSASKRNCVKKALVDERFLM